MGDHLLSVWGRLRRERMVAYSHRGRRLLAYFRKAAQVPLEGRQSGEGWSRPPFLEATLQSEPQTESDSEAMLPPDVSIDAVNVLEPGDRFASPERPAKGAIVAGGSSVASNPVRPLSQRFQLPEIDTHKLATPLPVSMPNRTWSQNPSSTASSKAGELQRVATNSGGDDGLSTPLNASNLETTPATRHSIVAERQPSNALSSPDSAAADTIGLAGAEHHSTLSATAPEWPTSAGSFSGMSTPDASQVDGNLETYSDGSAVAANVTFSNTLPSSGDLIRSSPKVDTQADSAREMAGIPPPAIGEPRSGDSESLALPALPATPLHQKPNGARRARPLPSEPGHDRQPEGVESLQSLLKQKVSRPEIRKQVAEGVAGAAGAFVGHEGVELQPLTVQTHGELAGDEFNVHGIDPGQRPAVKKGGEQNHEAAVSDSVAMDSLHSSTSRRTLANILPIHDVTDEVQADNVSAMDGSLGADHRGEGTQSSQAMEWKSPAVDRGQSRVGEPVQSIPEAFDENPSRGAQALVNQSDFAANSTGQGPGPGAHSTNESSSRGTPTTEPSVQKAVASDGRVGPVVETFVSKRTAPVRPVSSPSNSSTRGTQKAPGSRSSGIQDTGHGVFEEHPSVANFFRTQGEDRSPSAWASRLFGGKLVSQPPPRTSGMAEQGSESDFPDGRGRLDRNSEVSEFPERSKMNAGGISPLGEGSVDSISAAPPPEVDSVGVGSGVKSPHLRPSHAAGAAYPMADLSREIVGSIDSLANDSWSANTVSSETTSRPSSSRNASPPAVGHQVVPIREAVAELVEDMVGVPLKSVQIIASSAIDQQLEAQLADAAAVDPYILVHQKITSNDHELHSVVAHELTHIGQQRYRDLPPLDARRRDGSRIASGLEVDPERQALSMEQQARQRLANHSLNEGRIANQRQIAELDPSNSRFESGDGADLPDEHRQPGNAVDWNGLPRPWEPFPDWLTQEVPLEALVAQDMGGIEAVSAGPQVGSGPTQYAAAERTQSSSEQSGYQKETGGRKAPEHDLDALARKVYVALRRRLLDEHRRGSL